MDSTPPVRIGVDGRKIPQAKARGPLGTLDHAVELGLDGVFFRTVLDISPELDAGLLAGVRSRADELDLYLEAGLGKVNPYANPETPEVRAIGDGDTLFGFQRMIGAAAAAGIDELWISTAGAKPYRGRFSTDRFRTDVSWADQLEATRRFLDKLAPIARDLGVHLNLETHEEITTFEVLRLIEQVGDDVIGIVFDTANVLRRGEHPVRAARRIAPYVRQTHLKDAHVEFTADGAYFDSVACGAGLIDFTAVIEPLMAQARPGLNLTFECAQPTDELEGGKRPAGTEPHLIQLFHPEWIANHPDLTREEYAAYVDLIRGYTDRVRAGEVPTAQQLRDAEMDYAEAVAWIKSSESHVLEVLETLGIARHVRSPR